MQLKTTKGDQFYARFTFNYEQGKTAIIQSFERFEREKYSSILLHFSLSGMRLTATIKIEHEKKQKLDKFLASLLLRENIKITLQEAVGLIIDYALENEEDIIKRLQELPPLEEDLAWKKFETLKDKPISFTACTTLAHMEKNHINQIMSFDSGFNGLIQKIPNKRCNTTEA